MPRTPGTRKGNGKGWGGQAKGEGSKGERHADFEAGNQEAVGNGPAQIAARATRDSMLLIYETVAADERQPGQTRINAAEKWLDRHEGKAIARNITANVDDLSALSDADLHAELARLGREEAEAQAGTAPSGLPGGPGGVVH